MNTPLWGTLFNSLHPPSGQGDMSPGQHCNPTPAERRSLAPTPNSLCHWLLTYLTHSRSLLFQRTICHPPRTPPASTLVSSGPRPSTQTSAPPGSGPGDCRQAQHRAWKRRCSVWPMLDQWPGQLLDSAPLRRHLPSANHQVPTPLLPEVSLPGQASSPRIPALAPPWSASLSPVSSLLPSLTPLHPRMPCFPCPSPH